MQIGIRKEAGILETRVAVTPDGVSKLIKQGFTVLVETNAGEASSYTDQAYLTAGAQIVTHEQASQADIIFAINPPEISEVATFKPGATLVSFIQPNINKELVQALEQRNITVLAMDMVPRISRAQSMDALSSLANIAGYRAVIEAASQFGRFLNGQITAAGKIAPAKVLVIGTGVAGLAAIGTAKNLGAQVRAFDARIEAKEQVESMGAKFLTINYVEQQQVNDGYTRSTSEEFNKKSAELYLQQAKEVDIIITTANIPGRKAPLLITKEMLDVMKPGSVVVDIAAPTGGNVEGTVADQVVTTTNDVKIVGYTNYQAMLGNQASSLYSNNLVNLTKLLCPAADGTLTLNQEDVIVRNMLVLLHNTNAEQATMLFPPPPISVSAQSSTKATQAQTSTTSSMEQADDKDQGRFGAHTRKQLRRCFFGGILAWVYFQLTAGLPQEFMTSLNLFVIASILGYFVIWNVHSALHTPLMSLTNALSGIVVMGAMYQIVSGTGASDLVAYIAVFIAALNVFGGFAVTQRMLKMFIKKDQKVSTTKGGK